MRLIRLLLITVLFSTISLRALADDDVEFAKYARMISYEQFERLDPEVREAYREGLRLLLLEMEEMQTKRGKVDPQLRRRLNAYDKFLKEFLQTADAMGNGSGGNVRCMGPTFMYVRSGPRTLRCVTRASQSKVCRITPQDQNWLRNLRSEMASFRRTRQTPAPAPDRSRRGTVKNTQTIERRTERPAPQRQISSDKSAPAASTASDLSLVPEVQVCVEEASATTARTMKCDRASIDAAREIYFGGEGHENRNQCIYAGHLRPFKSASAEPGKCKPIHEWCLSADPQPNENPEECREAMDPAHRKVTAFSCSPSQVLCNPLLFGLTRDGERGKFSAICVPKAGAATRACYMKMQSERSNGRQVELADPLERNELEQELTPDQRASNERQLQQVRPLWERLATDLKTMCITDKVSRQVFCEECFYIRERLLQLAMLASKHERDLCGAEIGVTEEPQAVPTVSGEQIPATQALPQPAVSAPPPATIAPAPGARPVDGAAAQ